MQNLDQTRSIDQLKVGNTYIEHNNDYYLYTCLSIDYTVKNGGFNDYYQSAVFSVITKTGRKLQNGTKHFTKI